MCYGQLLCYDKKIRSITSNDGHFLRKTGKSKRNEEEGSYNMIACLIIHGYTGGPYEVEPLSTYLKEKTDWDVFVPTLPGHGIKLDLKNVSHTKWIEAIDDVMNELKDKYDKVYVIGFSMGGMLAAYVAGKYPVDKLVLLSTAGRYLSFKQIFLDLKGVVYDGFRGKLKENILFARYRDKLGQVPFRANLEFLKLIRFTRSYLKEVDSPVFIAQGQQDGIVPASTVSYLDKEITSEQKEIVLFEKSKHLICLGNDKDTLNAMIGDFLNIEKAKE